MKKYLFIVTLVCIMFASCKKDDELSFSDSELNVDYSATTKEVKITAGTNWTVKTEADWITLTPSEGSGNATLKIDISENFDDFERYVDVILSQVGGEGLSATLKVRQQPASHERQLHHRRQDSLALVALYNATNGDGWKNKTGWKTDRLEGWYGLEIRDNRVVMVSLENLLTGNIPPEIGKLSNLRFLWLSGNQLSGNIPSEIGNLSKLQSLILDGNMLTGSIPAEIGRLNHLELLSLSNNQLSGSIPAEIGNLTRLGNLYLNNNQLTGEVPEAVINMISAYDYLSICPQNGAGFSNYSCQ
ncbi:MAG: hypothetical protein LBV26_05305 [Bacteroidales bacterium]|jgi:hypothetical protein|nr:hypothetical protein [Bacteroidales bacterium]